LDKAVLVAKAFSETSDAVKKLSDDDLLTSVGFLYGIGAYCLYMNLLHGGPTAMAPEMWWS
jgi:hypothetical protein